jgi:threonine dehydrogenase-like Zn-dependent dehydrogenase
MGRRHGGKNHPDRPLPRRKLAGMERMLQLVRNGRVDPTRMTTHTLTFDQLEQAFTMMDRKLDWIIKPLITS